jgi:hypothetical protein
MLDPLYFEKISRYSYSIFYIYLKSKGNDWFALTARQIEHETTLTKKEQDKFIKRLIELGCIETKLMGLPAKKHFRIL